MSAPDLIEPVIGFRAWWPDRDGRLVPWSMAGAGAWDVDVTTAHCGRGSKAEHSAPGHDCSCGLYALTDHRDPRLICDEQAVGAIIAWGEMEVHRTGFRAQHACIIALALPAECHGTHRARLAAAALRYRVPLVPPDQLLAIALEHGQRLPFGALADPPTRPLQPEMANLPPLLPGGPLGTAIDEHLHLHLDEDCLWVELTPALAAQFPSAADVRPMTTPGTAVARGDVLATVGITGDQVVLRSPISALLGPATGTSAGDWRMSLFPTKWAEEATDLDWGEPGLRRYAAFLVEDRRRGDPFESIRSRWLHGWAHVRRPLTYDARWKPGVPAPGSPTPTRSAGGSPTAFRPPLRTRRLHGTSRASRCASPYDYTGPSATSSSTLPPRLPSYAPVSRPRTSTWSST